MITNVHGDILLSNARAIAHGVAPHDHFNQGLALALREHHPAMAKDFRHYCRQENPKPGHAWLWAGPERVVINLMTQAPAASVSAARSGVIPPSASTGMPSPAVLSASHAQPLPRAPGFDSVG